MAIAERSWSVKMAQYVPPLSADALAAVLPFFKKQRRTKLSGTWLSSRTTATVTLSCGSPDGLGPSIALILQGHVHEEHLLATLAFTWPSFCDENGGTMKPCRVILASYKKIDTDEKRKFAMQFETVLQAECFYETIKQLTAGPRGASEDTDKISATQQEFATPVPQVDVLKSCSLENNFAPVSHGSGIQALHETTRTRSPSRIPPHSTGFTRQSAQLVLPPRFPLGDLQNYSNREQANIFQEKGEIPTVTVEGLLNERYLKEKIKACFLDPEFQDFVDRVERVWHTMEDDLGTEMTSIADKLDS